MRYVPTAYENATETIDFDGDGGYAGRVKTTLEFTADHLPNVLEQVRLFLCSVGFDYVRELVDVRDSDQRADA